MLASLGNPIISFFLSLFLLVFMVLGFFTIKLTRGYSFGYLNRKIGHVLKIFMLLIHGLSSLVLALILPNNYLSEIKLFREIYKVSGLWIPISIIVLLFVFLILLGSLFTLITIGKRENIE
jgi:hypothetical protein